MGNLRKQVGGKGKFLDKMIFQTPTTFCGPTTRQTHLRIHYLSRTGVAQARNGSAVCRNQVTVF
jgi:hypothetical protein